MSFEYPNGHSLNANGYTSNTNGRAHRNGDRPSDYTSSNDQSVNGESYESASYSESHKDAAVEPIAIIGMGWSILCVYTC